jgi:hypothetical protein
LLLLLLRLLLLLLQLTAASPCNALAWCRHCPGLPPLLLAGADSGAAVWRYNQPAMTWEVRGGWGVTGVCEGGVTGMREGIKCGEGAKGR